MKYEMKGTPQGRRPRVTRERIVEVAATLPEPLTMSSVAKALGVTHAALYHHIDDIEELYQLVADEAFGKLEPVDAADLEGVIRQAMDRLYAVLHDLRAMPSTLTLVTPRATTWLEGVVTRLVELGMKTRTATHMTRYICRLNLSTVRDRVSGLFTQGTKVHEVIYRNYADRGLVHHRPDIVFRRWFDVESMVGLAQVWLARDLAGLSDGPGDVPGEGGTADRSAGDGSPDAALGCPEVRATASWEL